MSDGLPIKKDALIGNWIVIRTTTKDVDAYNAIARSQFSNLKERTELNMFSYKSGGAGTADMGRIEHLDITWTFNSAQQLVMQPKEQSPYENSGRNYKPTIFTTRYYKNDSMIIESVTRGKGDSVYVRNIFIKLKSNDSIPDLFSPALNKWREKPTNAEDDEAIRTRLKQVLYYYSAYFASLAYNKVPYFNIKRIYCPILFYNGGLGLKKLDRNDEWMNVFRDLIDAVKAHTMLSKAFSRVKNFPNKGRDYVAEYVIALKLIADNL